MEKYAADTIATAIRQWAAEQPPHRNKEVMTVLNYTGVQPTENQVVRHLIIRWTEDGWEHSKLTDAGQKVWDQAPQFNYALSMKAAVVELYGYKIRITRKANAQPQYAIHFLD